ncbi:MAG: NADP-dependent oxidoreductase [Cellvibrionaceae bacterium]|nr:NADP-dependent oxidoreductase [Cellvibrionaceae bacterium]|tara:strand:+ start:13841 stop:14848 length:1008 start_codon:yes stop_codon:yes gene_type:complete
MRYLNHQIILKRRTDGLPCAGDFSLGEQWIDGCGAGEVLVRNYYLSVDPAQKGWMGSAVNYASAVVGQPMRALAVGEVLVSQAEGFSVGDFVVGWLGWQEYACVTTDKIQTKVDPTVAPLRYALGALGLNGLTAYIALNDILSPDPEDTVLVSTAAGGVGSIVGQLAKRRGCHIVGLTSSDAKARLCCCEYGYDRVVNYTASDWLQQLKAACPNGVDRYFDMVGGWITDEVIGLMNHSGVHAQVGTAAVEGWSPVPLAPRRERAVLVKELTHKGFIAFNHEHRFDHARRHLLDMIDCGALNYREDIRDGLASAPAALVSLYEGTNTGKTLVRLVD